MMVTHSTIPPLNKRFLQRALVCDGANRGYFKTKLRDTFSQNSKGFTLHRSLSRRPNTSITSGGAGLKTRSNMKSFSGGGLPPQNEPCVDICPPAPAMHHHLVGTGRRCLLLAQFVAGEHWKHRAWRVHAFEKDSGS